MQPKFNAGRSTPGMESTPQLRVSHGMPNIPHAAIPTMSCPWGIICRQCKIAIHKDGRLECSIKILATEAMKEGIRITNTK